jgi:hypothetical protein
MKVSSVEDTKKRDRLGLQPGEKMLLLPVGLAGVATDVSDLQ